ncbi:hypothetical protein [Bdellovibrio svalbardensis]|uniref:Lipoprotein n=1 Tax=Bdellovibrio svalbardensis TaxID=2972972 RepID=A0ABT6DPZ6_9BACT|nr:hypothetical protein [Bdellovibrio svalbardensis]MDG0817999.1 hypothetical protein [Bdellovibrio svalbardensis]
MKKLILAITILGLASCAYDKDKSGSSPQTKKVNEQNAQIQDDFRPVAGYYSGTLHRANGDEKVDLNLDILGYKDGTNPDGTDRIRFKQSAAYMKVNPVGKPLVNFSVTYVPETGDLTLLNLDAASNIDDVHTIKAKILNGRITGLVKSSTRDIGTLDLRLSANENANPGNGAQEEYNERLRRQYAELVGSYIGCVTPAEGGSVTAAYTVQMNLSLYEDGSDANTTHPRLAGNFHRDYDKLGGLDAALSATYRPDLAPATLNIVGKPNIANNGYVSTFTGTYVEGQFSGNFTSTKKGLEGYIFLKKGKTYPAQCASVTK